MPRTWAACSTPSRSGGHPDLATFPRSGRRSRRSAGRTGTRGALVDLVEKRIGLVVEYRRNPSAALESAPAVLVRPAESLHHPVDGDHREGRQFHGRSSLLVLAEVVVIRFCRTAAPISSVRESVRPSIPHPPRTSAMSSPERTP